MNSEIDRQYERMLTAFTDIELIERALRDNTREQYRTLTTNSDSLKSEGLEAIDAAHHNMTFRSLQGGETIFYRTISRDSKQLRLDLLVHQNKQYQWLLADAYEWFEDYIKFAYGVAGYKNSLLWRPTEIKKLHNANGTSPNLAAYLASSFNFRDTGDILDKINRFRTVFGALKVAEKSNLNYHSPKFTLALIEMLRHIIVHNGGRLKDKQAFVQKTFRRAGLSLAGVDSSAYTSQIDTFLATLNGETVVHLLDAGQSELPGAYVSRLGVLLDLLLAYAHIIHGNVLCTKT